MTKQAVINRILYEIYLNLLVFQSAMGWCSLLLSKSKGNHSREHGLCALLGNSSFFYLDKAL